MKDFVGHGILKCSECNTIIMQCKCMESHKNVSYDVCDECRKKLKKKAEEKQMNHENFSKGLSFVLKEMCMRVGANFESIDFKKENWFYEYTWSTKEQEQEFVDWLAEELRKSKKLRKDILKFPNIKNKKELKKCALWFNVNYGWKLEEKK